VNTPVFIIKDTSYFEGISCGKSQGGRILFQGKNQISFQKAVRVKFGLLPILKESLIVAVFQTQLLCQDRKETGVFDISLGNDSVDKICPILLIYFQNFLIIFLTQQVMF